MLPFIVTMWRLLRSIAGGMRDGEFRGLLYVVIVILLGGTLFYHGVEHWKWLDSLFFSVTTLTTVGYGNFVPHTDLGKIFTIVYIFLGLGTILGFVNAVAHQARSERHRHTSSRNITALSLTH
jgi:voltage-gated potassium channel